MGVRVLVVEAVSRRSGGQVAVRVAPPESGDLQFIYRAGLSIYWNPAESLLEDRSDVVASAEGSAARIAKALREEYGMALQPSGEMLWTGVIDEERDRVAVALFE
jgi:hypothetical protein